MKFNFTLLNSSHYLLLSNWLSSPHVSTWWGNPLSLEEVKKKYDDVLKNKVSIPYIAFYDNKPIAFIQLYFAQKVGGGWWTNVPKDTIGIDQFIGDQEYLGLGLGKQLIQEFLTFIEGQYGQRNIIVDPRPDNKIEIKCYEAVGFKYSITK